MSVVAENQSEWRPVLIPGHPEASLHFSVSSNGEIRRETDSIFKKKGDLLKPTVESEGYSVITLIWPGFRKMMKVHRLVAMAFIPNQYQKPQVNHLNGVRSDNRLTNLEWSTNKENNIHAIKILGRKHESITGENQWNARLTEQDVKEIRAWWATGDVTQRALGLRWGVGQPRIGKIVNRKQWRHVA